MLKEKVTERLRYNPDLLYMEAFLYPYGKLDRVNLAGLILLASGHHLQLRSSASIYNNAQLPLSAPHIYKHWVAYERKVFEAIPGRFDDITIEIPALARQLWSEEYGDLAAKELPFYEAMSPNEETCEWWWNCSLNGVSARHIIFFLNGGQPRVLSKPGD